MVKREKTPRMGTNVLKRPSTGVSEKRNYAPPERVRGVVWNPTRQYWHAYRYEGGRRFDKYFGIAKYLRAGMSSEEAQQRAMEAAIAFRSSNEASIDSAVDRPRSRAKRSAGKACASTGVTVHAPTKSGVPGVSWLANRNAWQVHCYAHGRRQCHTFSVRKYLDPGMNQQQAKAAALQAAIALRRSKEASGEALVDQRRQPCFSQGGRSTPTVRPTVSKPTASTPTVSKPTVARRLASDVGCSTAIVARRPASEPSRGDETEVHQPRIKEEVKTEPTIKLEPEVEIKPVRRRHSLKSNEATQ